ncbi:hypothetical protein LZC95_00775 [Pendulispora brunnea]|uniref:Uncharacterized protein n=1 Tax=Pendulispora brunnea TaxID=2905690 RepID=A0ABZ2KBC0_9BACT
MSSPVDFPHVFLTRDLGDARSVRKAVEEALSDVQWFGGRGYIAEPSGTTAEVTLWRDGTGAVEDGVVDRLTVSIHDDGDPMTIVGPLCRMHGWSACDSALHLIDAQSVRTIWSSTTRSDAALTPILPAAIKILS